MMGCDAHGDLNDSKFSKPLPSIGLYVALASLICGLSMAADLLHGFRHRKFWFPCKLFSLNATSLTFIGVGIKLSVDLNTSMPSRQDQLAKLSSSVFVCTVMGNSMPSLGIMDNKDLLMNLMALGILVITDVVNICIQLGTGAIYVFPEEHCLVVALMLLLLLILCFSAITVPTTKSILDSKYKKKYEIALKCPLATERTGAKKIQQDLMKFWMMAHTSSPQFVMARSVTCTASGFFCFLSAITLGEAMVRSYWLRPSSLGFCHGDSDYKWSTTLVLISQTTAVAVGTVAPTIRWFTAVNFRCPTRGKKYCRDEFKVESYWTQWLSEKKQRPLSFWILKSRRSRKLAHRITSWILDVCIVIQYGIVLASKFIRFISVFCVSRILICCYLAFKTSTRTVSHDESETSSSNPSSRAELARFVLHLEGEEELVELMVRSNREATDHWIEKGRKKQPLNLIELLETTTPISKGFEGIQEFDSDEVASLASGEPPNGWALPLVTLASIAAALPNVNPCSLKKLLSAVTEALVYVTKFEKILDIEGELVNSRKAAEVVWLGVYLYHKWFDVDLRKLSKKQTTPEETLRELVEIAKKEFSESWQLNLMVCMKYKPSLWPIRTLAANSMYRICQTILLNYELRDYGTGQGRLFRELESLISDIVSGCFCNTAHVISLKCLVTAVEVREESVRGAALHLGRTEKILEILDRRCLPELRCDRLRKMDEWRAFYKMNTSCSESSTPSSHSKNTVSSQSDADVVCLNVE